MATKQKQAVQIFNAVRATMGEDFKERIPQGTIDNFTDVANPLLKYEVHFNEFIETLVDKVSKTMVRHILTQNPLHLLKKGDKPLGLDVEEIKMDLVKAKNYDRDGADLLKREDMEAYALYHRLNRKDYYPVTINKTEIKRGFKSWDSLMNLIDKVVSNLYASATHDEFLLTKQLLVDGINGGIIQTLEVEKPVDNQTAKNFTKAIKFHSGQMEFVSGDYTTYEKPDGTKLYHATPKSKQVLIIRNDVYTEVDVELLAQAFNMSKTDFREIDKIIVVDNFNEREDVLAILMDRAMAQIYDDLYELAEPFRNPANLTTKYYLHVHQTYSLSKFANGLALVEKSVAGTDKVTEDGK